MRFWRMLEGGSVGFVVGGISKNLSLPEDGQRVRKRGRGGKKRDDGVQSCGRLDGHMLVTVLKCPYEIKQSLTPMLIKAIMIRIDRENMIELSGMGVPIVVTLRNQEE